MVDFRAELQALVTAYDEHGGNWLPGHEDALLAAVERARAVLAAAQGEAGPSDEELRRIADLHLYPGGRDYLLNEVSFARDVLTRWVRPAQPAPVPVSKGHPTNADCDRAGRCWWFDPHYHGGAWFYDSFFNTYSHWLPVGAMPRPGLNTTTETP